MDQAVCEFLGHRQAAFIVQNQQQHFREIYLRSRRCGLVDSSQSVRSAMHIYHWNCVGTCASLLHTCTLISPSFHFQLAAASILRSCSYNLSSPAARCHVQLSPNPMTIPTSFYDLFPPVAMITFRVFQWPASISLHGKFESAFKIVFI